MSDHIVKTIEQAKEELRKHEEAILNIKKMINQLCMFANMQPEYQDADLLGPSNGPVIIRRNAFFGKPLATCVREFLEMRKDKPVKEATLNEIFEALKEGGYDLDKISKDDDTAKRGVAITLGKNPQFLKLPNNDWGLLSWYPSVKKGRNEGKANGEKNNEEKTDLVTHEISEVPMQEHIEKNECKPPVE